MGRIAKTNGTVAITGSDGRITGNIAAETLAGPTAAATVDGVNGGVTATFTSFDDPSEYGECDTCRGPYDTSSRDGRCGDCGDCGQCCLHIEPDVIIDMFPAREEAADAGFKQTVGLIYDGWFNRLRGDDAVWVNDATGECKTITRDMLDHSWLHRQIDYAVSVEQRPGVIEMKLESGEKLRLWKSSALSSAVGCDGCGIAYMPESVEQRLARRCGGCIAGE